MGKNFNDNIKANNFVVLDIENPNSRGNSICSIGILIIEDGALVRKEYSLINPEDRFDRTNSEITGITESMVLDSPTLKEYWQEIGTTLSDSVIVGHNIKYDLSVLSKALYRYDMPVPAFRYICTLDLSHSLLSAPSYKLSSLLGNLGISYDEHNALADAEAAYKLLDYLDSNFDLSSFSVNTYEYEHTLKQSLDSKLASNINDLYGIIQGINYDGVFDSMEVQFLQKWVDDNSKYRDFAVFNRIINELTLILEDGIVTDYERQVLSTLVDSVASSNMYSDSTLGIQILEGLVKGIVCNNEINDSEILNLQRWLSDNDYLKGGEPIEQSETHVDIYFRGNGK